MAAAKVKTFIVKRSQWSRGGQENGENGDNFLRCSNGKQCCLGFIGRQSGVKAKDMLKKHMPRSLPKSLYNLFPKLNDSNVDENIGNWQDFSDVNDDIYLSGKEREKLLKELAKQHGFRFKFVP